VDLQVVYEQSSNSLSLSVVHCNPLADAVLRDPKVVCKGLEKEKVIDLVPEKSQYLQCGLYVK
jgi:hypothetical protein